MSEKIVPEKDVFVFFLKRLILKRMSFNVSEKIDPEKDVVSYF